MAIAVDNFEAFVRALRRAEERHIRVTGFEVTEDADTFRTTSSSGAGGHRVRIDAVSGHITCDCVHGQIHGPHGWCTHKATTVAFLIGSF